MKFRRMNIRTNDYPRVFSKPTFHVIQNEAEFLATYGITSYSPRVDFDRYVVIAVHRGLCRTGGYGIRIEEVRRIGRTVLVKFHLRDPAPDEFVSLVMTYPSDMVYISRDELDPGDGSVLVFSFRDDRGNEMHRLPVTLTKGRVSSEEKG